MGRKRLELLVRMKLLIASKKLSILQKANEMLIEAKKHM